MAVCSSNSKVFIRVICHKIRPAQRLAVSDAPTVIAMAPRLIFKRGACNGWIARQQGTKPQSVNLSKFSKRSLSIRSLRSRRSFSLSNATIRSCDFWSSCPEVPVARSFLQELYAVISAAVLPFKMHLCAQAVWLNSVRNMAVSRVRVIRTAFSVNSFPLY